jgi:hypothetical protein
MICNSLLIHGRCGLLLIHGRCGLLLKVQRGHQRASCRHVAHFCLVAFLAAEVWGKFGWRFAGSGTGSCDGRMYKSAWQVLT